MRKSPLGVINGVDETQNLGSRANALHSCECFNIFKIAGRCIGCILGSYPGDGWVRLPLPLPISWHDKIEEMNASAMGVDDYYDKLDNLCLSY